MSANMPDPETISPGWGAGPDKLSIIISVLAVTTPSTFALVTIEATPNLVVVDILPIKGFDSYK